MARLLAIANVVTDRGCGLLKTLLAPLPTALGALPGVLDSDVRQSFPTIAWYWVAMLRGPLVVFLMVSAIT
jgi:hypothetical protein